VRGKNIFSILIVFCLLIALLWTFFYADHAIGGPYLNSAHGNTAYGVNRSATATIGYTKGHCGHCHEQHASIGATEPVPTGGDASPYAVFSNNFISQSQNFCLDCHKGMGSVQMSFDRVNYNYSYWFGGDTINQITPNNIYDAMNPAPYGCCDGSRHDLETILNFVKTQWPATFKDESNPCNACHNPHLSQRGFPIVRPTDRNNIWGDSPGEKMSDYALAHGSQYMAPYRYNSTATYEPDGSAINDGSNVPDYITFCSDCHNAPNRIDSLASLTPGYDPDNCAICVPREIKQIDSGNMSRTYGMAGDYHGSITRCFDVDGTKGGVWRACGCFKESYFTAHPHPPDYYTDECPAGYARDAVCASNTTDSNANGIPDNIEFGNCCCISTTTGKSVAFPAWWGAIKPPYETANYPNFVLNCTDCHEPHGSQRPYLLRTTVNGKWWHTWTPVPGPAPSWDQRFCSTCHYHYRDKTVSTYVPEFNVTISSNGWHCGGPGSCINCHNHNSYDRCWACTWCPTGGVHGHAF